MTNLQMAVFTLICAAWTVAANLIQKVALDVTLVGLAVLLVIVFVGVCIYKLIYKLTGWKGLPTVAYICTFGCIATIPLINVAGANGAAPVDISMLDFVGNKLFSCLAHPLSWYAGKVSFLGLCTPILAYAGLSVGKDMDAFKRLSWRIVIVGLFVFVGTFLGSAVIAEAVLRYMGN